MYLSSKIAAAALLSGLLLLAFPSPTNAGRTLRTLKQVSPLVSKDVNNHIGCQETLQLLGGMFLYKLDQSRMCT
jgi:hypothetical protein